MKKFTILSIVTASLLSVATASEATNEKSSIGDIIKSAVSEVKIQPKVIEKKQTSSKDQISSLVADFKFNLKKEIKSELKVELEAELRAELKSELKADLTSSLRAELKPLLKSEIKSELTAELLDTLRIQPKSEIKLESDIKTVDTKVKSDVFDYKLQPKQVAENVWCFFGALDKPTKENAGNMVNGCYIKTNDGWLVMDTGPSYAYAKQTYEAMSKIAKLPVKYVVNSHEHDDHWLGNDFYKKKFNATLIGPESINTNYKEGDKTRMYNILPANAIEGTHIIDLDKIVKKTITLNFGGEEFRIIPMDVKAHTGDDVFIYMPKRKVLFAGDLVMNGRITSGRHGSVMGQLKALAVMKKLDWKVLIPGHGVITDATAMDEADLYFKLTKDRILKAIEEGVDATEINEVVKLIEFKDKAMYDILNAHNIGFAYDELEMLE